MGMTWYENGYKTPHGIMGRIRLVCNGIVINMFGNPL
jgi:hypothetical protein